MKAREGLGHLFDVQSKLLAPPCAVGHVTPENLHRVDRTELPVTHPDDRFERAEIVGLDDRDKPLEASRQIVLQSESHADRMKPLATIPLVSKALVHVHVLIAEVQD